MADNELTQHAEIINDALSFLFENFNQVLKAKGMQPAFTFGRITVVFQNGNVIGYADFDIHPKDQDKSKEVNK